MLTDARENSHPTFHPSSVHPTRWKGKRELCFPLTPGDLPFEAIFRARVFGPVGATAQFQYSSNLTDWIDSGAPVVFETGRGVMSDFDAHQYSQRFYRVVLR